MDQLHDKGSSPHVRGALLRWRRGSCRYGIIPACAGSTARFSTVNGLTGDHPRMCGEHMVGYLAGTDATGSSPHVRGAHAKRMQPMPDTGIIPACAGSTRGRPADLPSRRDHPRMCGEHAGKNALIGLVLGSSPHVRGALICTERGEYCGGIIPACAGSTRG